MSKKTIKANSVNETHGHIEFEQPQPINVIAELQEYQQEPLRQQTEEPKYPKELLVKSKALSEFHLHPDVIRAILVEPEYTISNAKQALQKYIDSFNQ